jgi:hypothetical protein
MIHNIRCFMDPLDGPATHILMIYDKVVVNKEGNSESVRQSIKIPVSTTDDTERFYTITVSSEALNDLIAKINSIAVALDK